MYIKIISMLYLNSTSPKIENSFSSHSSGYNFVAATTPVLPKLKVWRWWLSKLKKSCREYLTNSGWNHLMTLKVIWKKSVHRFFECQILSFEALPTFMVAIYWKTMHLDGKNNMATNPNLTKKKGKTFVNSGAIRNDFTRWTSMSSIYRNWKYLTMIKDLNYIMNKIY